MNNLISIPIFKTKENEKMKKDLFFKFLLVKRGNSSAHRAARTRRNDKRITIVFRRFFYHGTQVPCLLK